MLVSHLSPVVLVAVAALCACGATLPRGAQPEKVALASAEAEPLPAPVPLDPFAPVRTSPTDYAWQRSQRANCETRGPLRFEGSHGEFPLLPEDVPGAAAAPDTWGSGSPAVAATEPASPRSADQVVAALRPRLRRCFSSWVERGTTGEGSVRFAVQIDCGGEVRAVTAKSSGVDEPTISCLFGVVARASFESPVSGRATLQIPVVFKNTER
jgi:hypothetical protein